MYIMIVGDIVPHTAWYNMTIYLQHKEKHFQKCESVMLGF